MPILQAPADENDTMTTVMNKFKAISTYLGQRDTVIVVDQPLYSRAKELTWACPENFTNVTFLLGDLHILFNFLKTIGQHIDSAGLDDIWVEAGLFARNSTEQMLDGKAYYRAIRGHVLAYEAIFKISWQMFLDWLQSTNRQLNLDTELHNLVEAFTDDGSDSPRCLHEFVLQLTNAMQRENMNKLFAEFKRNFQNYPNFLLLSSYMDMVEILLDFIRANREGNWQLHLDAFAAMLPWMTVYDHTNYARWGPVYLADMTPLPTTAPVVYNEFAMGNFVVRSSNHRFSQVPIDQATEWVNRMCKLSNSIIGITRNDTARDRFCTTWAERSHISHATKVMMGLRDDDEAISTRNDALLSRQKSDEEAVERLSYEFDRFNVFQMRPSFPIQVDQHRGPRLSMKILDWCHC